VYTVYKTTNVVNGNYYFGVHKTKNPYDSYFGSGTYIKHAVAKYGVGDFRKDVLFIYLDAESAFAKEDELVQCYRIDALCKNLRKGGSGGFDYINKNLPRGPQKLNDESVVEIRRLAVEEGKFAKELGEQFSVSPRTVLAILRGTAPSWEHVTKGTPVVPAHRAPKRGGCYTEEHRGKIGEAQRRYFKDNVAARAATGERFKNYWKGRQKSADHCKKLGDVNRRRKNPILGRVWINSAGFKKLVLPEEVESFTQQGWKEGMSCRTV